MTDSKTRRVATKNELGTAVPQLPIVHHTELLRARQYSSILFDTWECFDVTC